MLALPAVDPIDDRIAAAARGDRAAAERLCRAILPRVRNLVRYLVRRDGQVDDIAQDALIAVLRGLGGYRGEGRFESWVDRIVARTTFAALRHGRVELAARPVSEERDGAGDPAGGEAAVLRRQLAGLLDELPAEQREALVLHVASGMTLPEVAELTSAPLETVRSRVRLAKARLRERLGASGGGDA